jgi:hypothetical protein
MDEINYEFIAVSKVINHKIGLDAAIVLATLNYKYKYWEDQKKLTTKGSLKAST